jgi:hypothetical protein
MRREQSGTIARLVAIAALLLVVPTEAGAEDLAARGLVVVVSASWRGPESLDLATLRRIYLGQRTELDGRRVHPLHLPLGSPEREAFSRDVLERKAVALERYWIAQALQGGALPPREVKDPEAMLRALRADSRAIGYVPPDALGNEHGEGIRMLEVELIRR